MTIKLADLDFDYPERLVAIERAEKSRVMCVEGGIPRELPRGIEDVLAEFRAGDCLVINDTRVLRRRVFSESGLEILFLRPAGIDGNLRAEDTDWQVLCPATKWKTGTEQILPGGIRLQLLSRGRPQLVRASQALDDSYFSQFGELPLPPYIQKARTERHNRATDLSSYQTAWAKIDGSLAAPTASFHFSQEHLAILKSRGVQILRVTLHVGLGTFLPVSHENLDEHPMHAEFAEIPAETWVAIETTKLRGGRVWALGTTVTRTLESAASGLLKITDHGFIGETDLFIRPGFEFKVVDVLMTNFHQPRSTLLALVGAFAGLDEVKRCYAWAIEREFRLFSYGDFTLWI